MASLFERRDTFLTRVLRYKTVTYTRGGNSVSLTVGQGKSGSWDTESSSAQDLKHYRAFDIKTAELILNSVLTLPLEDDTITDADGTWTVKKPPQSEDSEPWFYIEGAARSMIRVHAWQGYGA